MGVDCADVRQIVHVPEDTESYIQETGRAVRDGKPALATLLLTKGKTNSGMREYVSNTTCYRRDVLFQDIDGYEHLDLGTRCLCCDISQTCDCNLCSEHQSIFSSNVSLKKSMLLTSTREN